MSTLRLLSYNVRYGGRGREQALAEVIRGCQPDVVLLQEATRPDVVERVADATGMAQWATFRRQSLGFMSRERVVHYEWHKPRFSRHAFLEVVPATMDVRLFGVHLSAVHAAWTERRRLMEVRALLDNVRAWGSDFHVLTGDFNTLAPGELLDTARLPRRLRPFVWLSGGEIRWRTVHEVLAAGYLDVYRHLSPDVPGVTFPTWDPHLRLDYVFTPEHHGDRITRCEVVRTEAAAEASDHFPLLTDIEE